MKHDYDYVLGRVAYYAHDTAPHAFTLDDAWKANKDCDRLMVFSAICEMQYKGNIRIEGMAGKDVLFRFVNPNGGGA